MPSGAEMLIGHMHVVYYDKNEMGIATTPKPQPEVEQVAIWPSNVM